MAEHLEADPNEDNERELDRCSFHKDQFDILVFNYRESKGKDGGRFLAAEDTLLKKELLSTKHKLLKSKYFLQALPSQAAYVDLIERISLTAKNVDKLLNEKSNMGEEFSVKTASLPDFDPKDIELLQVDPAEFKMPDVSLLSASEQEKAQKKVALLGESDILLNECRDIISSLKASAKL